MELQLHEGGGEQITAMPIRKSASGDATPIIAPSVSFLEIYDKKGMMQTSPLAIRLRIVFRQKPKKSLETMFVTSKYALVKLGVTRDARTISTIYGIRCVEPMRYEDLRQLRRDIFSRTGLRT